MAIRDDDGRSKRSEGNGMRRASTQRGGITTPSPDAHGSHVQGDRTTPPISMHHIDIADIMRQAAAHSAGLIPHRTDKKSNPFTPAA